MIPHEKLTFDFAAGNMNDSEKGLGKRGIYHLKDLRVFEQIRLPRWVWDHPILIAWGDFLKTKSGPVKM